LGHLELGAWPVAEGFLESPVPVQLHLLALQRLRRPAIPIAGEGQEEPLEHVAWMP